MNQTNQSINHHMFWHEVQMPGHEACHLDQHDELWQLDGMAVFSH